MPVDIVVSVADQLAVHSTPIVMQQLKAETRKIPGFIIAGQSNAKGRDYPADLKGKDKPDPRILQWPSQGKLNQLLIASDPLLGPDTKKRDKITQAHVGPGVSFGKAILEQTHYPQVVIIPTAVGGVSIDPQRGASLAKPNGEYYKNVLERAKAFLAASPDHFIAGVLMHQGESDAGHSSAYTSKLLKPWVENLRHELQLPKLPVVTGTYTADWVEDKLNWNDAPKASKKGLQASIKNAQADIPYLYTANLLDLPSRIKKGDEIHFTMEASRQHGRRAAFTLLNLVKDHTKDYAPTSAPQLESLSVSRGEPARLFWKQADGAPFPHYDVQITDEKGKTIFHKEGVEGLSIEVPKVRAKKSYVVTVKASNTLGQLESTATLTAIKSR